MTHKLPLPDEARLETLIVQVYESLSNPDQSRLSLIESKLLQQAKKNKPQKSLNKMPWWIVLLLAGSFATAAWWSGELFFNRQNEEISDKRSLGNDMINEDSSGKNNVDSDDKDKEQENRNYEDGESPIIYQRESF